MHCVEQLTELCNGFATAIMQ